MSSKSKAVVLITGYYGCSCHPYETEKECWQEHKKKLRRGDVVYHRHGERIGIVDKKEGSGVSNFYIVQFGNQPRDYQLQHAANLIKL